MVKFIEFLGRLVVRGYVRSAALERKSGTYAQKAAIKAAKLADEFSEKSQEAVAKAVTLENKASQLKAFFK